MKTTRPPTVLRSIIDLTYWHEGCAIAHGEPVEPSRGNVRADCDGCGNDV